MSTYYSKRVKLPAWLALPVVLLLFVPSGRAQSGSGITGVVTDPLGARMPDAVITLYSPDRVLKASTNQLGVFAFTNSMAGAYEVEASRPGFITKAMGTVHTDSYATKPLSITLAVADTDDCARKYGSISYGSPSDAGDSKLILEVRDSYHGLAGATVSLGKMSSLRALSSQRTNPDGKLGFKRLEAGRYILRVSHPGYYNAGSESFWSTRENQTTVVVQMLKHGLIRICE